MSQYVYHEIEDFDAKLDLLLDYRGLTRDNLIRDLRLKQISLDDWGATTTKRERTLRKLCNYLDISLHWWYMPLVEVKELVERKQELKRHAQERVLNELERRKKL